VIFGMPPVCLCISMYVRMCTVLAPGRLEGFYSYLLFKSLYVIGWCPGNLNILVTKIETPQMGPKKPNGNFLANGRNNLYLIPVIYGGHISK
jgi:hypothetical protein